MSNIELQNILERAGCLENVAPAQSDEWLLKSVITRETKWNSADILETKRLLIKNDFFFENKTKLMRIIQ